MTDKPTWFHKSILTGILRKSSSCINDMKQAYGVNIHITSDEKFVKDDYITDGIEVIRATPKLVDAQGLVNRRDWKKIILSTDEELIKDGVQKIGEGFLKWFMDNPDCEYIEVGKTNKLIDNYADNEKDKWEVTYHIYNPDNQPKFEESTDTTVDIMLLANSMFGKKEETLTIRLNKKEARGLLNCIMRTSAKGKDLDVGEMVEDKLVEFLNLK